VEPASGYMPDRASPPTLRSRRPEIISPEVCGQEHIFALTVSSTSAATTKNRWFAHTPRMTRAIVHAKHKTVTKHKTRIRRQEPSALLLVSPDGLHAHLQNPQHELSPTVVVGKVTQQPPSPPPQTNKYFSQNIDTFITETQPTPARHALHWRKGVFGVVAQVMLFRLQRSGAFGEGKLTGGVRCSCVAQTRVVDVCAAMDPFETPCGCYFDSRYMVVVGGNRDLLETSFLQLA